MGFSSENPNTVGNMLQSYASEKSPLLDGGINALAGDTKNPYGMNKDGTTSQGFFHNPQSGGNAPSLGSAFMTQLFGHAAPQATPPQAMDERAPPLPDPTGILAQNAKPKEGGLTSAILKAVMGGM